MHPLKICILKRKMLYIHNCLRNICLWFLKLYLRLINLLILEIPSVNLLFKSKKFFPSQYLSPQHKDDEREVRTTVWI